jgi:hypothetical protein
VLGVVAHAIANATGVWITIHAKQSIPEVVSAPGDD